MVYIKYFWGFDSSVEGWTGDNVVWEDGGNGGLPTPHLYGHKSKGVYHGGSEIITFKSPRNINVQSGDIICFIITYDGSIEGLTSKKLQNVTIEVVDSSESVIWSKTIGVTSSPANTPTVCIAKIEASGVGINIKINIYVSSYMFTNLTASYYARLDSVTVYQQPDQIIHTPIPSTLQSTVTHEIPINKSGAFVLGAIRFDDIQNLTIYNEEIIYDSSNTYDYGKGVCKTVTTQSSVDKVTIKHNADSTLQVYYECDHAVWLLDSNTWYPKWLAIIKCYHNQNMTNPDYVQFSTVLDGSSPYSNTQSMTFKFSANKLFNVQLTPESEITGDTSGITTLKATIVVKDSSGNTIGTCNYDILNNSFDQAITIDKSHDGEQLTIEITVNADGKVSETVTVKLKLNFTFTY